MTEWTRTLEVDGPARTQELAQRLGAQLRAGDLLVLTGELGAGKTTFTQGLARGLGVECGVISPTFVLVRRHRGGPGRPDLVHVDAYRLASAAEVDDLDLEDTADASVTVVEWGAGKVEHLAGSRLEVVLERAVGAGALGSPGAGPAAPGTDGGASGPALHAAGDPEDDDAPEPRRITLTGVGPRWAGGPPAL